MHPLHPMVVHFPIALLSTSVFCDLLAIRWRHDSCRVTSLSTLILGLLAAAVSVISGDMAEETVEHQGGLTRILEIHEQLGIATFWVFVGLFGLRVAEWLNWMVERPLLRIVVGLAAVGILFLTSYYGGSLVYDYGGGVTLTQ